MLPVFLILYETVNDDDRVERYAAVAPGGYSSDEPEGYGVDWYGVDSVLSGTAAGDGYTEDGTDAVYAEGLPVYNEQVPYLDVTDGGGDGVLDLSVRYLDCYEPRYAF